MSGKGHQPQRTCLGCGGRENQSQLIRLTLTDQNRLIVNEGRGRGGYLHRSPACWRIFIGRKVPYRAFHSDITRAAKEQLINEMEAQERE